MSALYPEKKRMNRNECFCLLPSLFNTELKRNTFIHNCRKTHLLQSKDMESFRNILI